MQHIHGDHTLYHRRVGDDSREGELGGEEGHARRRRERVVVVPESVAIAITAQLAREAHEAAAPSATALDDERREVAADRSAQGLVLGLLLRSALACSADTPEEEAEDGVAASAVRVQGSAMATSRKRCRPGP